MVAIFPSPPPINMNRSEYTMLIRESRIAPQHKSKERQDLQACQHDIIDKLTSTEKEISLTSDDEYPYYNDVPPKRTFTVKARFRFTGRMKPLPFILDDE